MEQLIKNHWGSITTAIYAVALGHRVPRSEIDDLVQDTIIHMLRYPVKSQARDELALLLGVARKRARQIIYEQSGFKQHAANKYKVTLSTESVGEMGLMEERMLPPMASAEDVFFSKLPNKRQETLRRAIQALPEEQRTVMTLRTYEELSVADTARRMGVGQADVRRIHNSAMRQLRRKLIPEKA